MTKEKTHYLGRDFGCRTWIHCYLISLDMPMGGMGVESSGGEVSPAGEVGVGGVSAHLKSPGLARELRILFWEQEAHSFGFRRFCETT